MAIDDIDESRERFEKHGIGKQWNLERRPDGRYDDVVTEFRWHDWQAAWEAAERDTRERIAKLVIEALEAAVANQARLDGTDFEIGVERGLNKAIKIVAERIRGVNR